MTDKVTPPIWIFYNALKIKGETAFEIAGMANAMVYHENRPHQSLWYMRNRRKRSKLVQYFYCMRVVISGAGIKIAKHGNKAISGKSGSADVLSELGVNISLKPEQVKRCMKILE